jgi:hypothetical protein
MEAIYYSFSSEIMEVKVDGTYILYRGDKKKIRDSDRKNLKRNHLGR